MECVLATPPAPYAHIGRLGWMFTTVWIVYRWGMWHSAGLTFLWAPCTGLGGLPAIIIRYLSLCYSFMYTTAPRPTKLAQLFSLEACLGHRYGIHCFVFVAHLKWT